MDLMTVFQRFPDHASCIEHMELVRWPDTPACPHCGAATVGRKADGDRIGRWNCHACHSSYNVLSGTIFEKTKIELQKWFLAISIILNAKKSVSSYQLARDLDLNQKTAWYMAMRIHRAMVIEGPLLAGIVEADEAYIGGKPRKPNKRSDDKRGHGGRGTNKLPIIGAVERGDRVVAEPSPHVDARSLHSFLNCSIEMRETPLVTDEWPGCRNMGRYVRHATIEHSTRYVDGLVHTNTIEGFWSLLKRTWYGTHHHYSKAFAIAYAVEACFKYNMRGATNGFEPFIRSTIAVKA